MKKRVRVSYVEVMVVAIVLGVAGKMITPQFTEAGNEEEKVSKLINGLEAMRSQIDLYRAQHAGLLPPTDSFKSFKTAMTTTVEQYGPYVKQIPTNPFNGLKTVRFDGESAGACTAGWRLDTKTGSFQADNDAACAAL